MGTRARVVVVGGGVVGVSVAYALAKRGASVVLLERAALAAGASFGNAGTVSAGHPPLNKPGRVRQAILQMADPTSPLYVKPRWDPPLWRWLLEFGRYCTEEHVEHCMRVMAPLGMEALRAFDALREDEGIDCGYRADGYWDVCRTERGLEDARHEASIIERYGYHPEVADAEGLRSVEPELGEVVGGVFYPEAATLRPRELVLELADAARRHGAIIREGVEVRDVLVEGDRAHGVDTDRGERVEGDAVVLCTGPFSGALARRLGTPLPVQPGKGYHRDFDVGPGGAPPLRIACVLHESSVFCTPLGGWVRFAGTMEFSGLNEVMRRPRLEQLTRAARAFFPALGTARPRSEWCGLRPVSVDGLPIVGPFPGLGGAYAATGHGMLGLTLGPVTGSLIAEWVMEGAPGELYTALSPERFARA